MERTRIIFLCLMFPLISSLTLTEAYGQNPVLRELAKEDQDYRAGKKVTQTDREREKLVLSLIAQGALVVPEDKFNAALVLEHTPLTLCDQRYVSLSADNYLLAHYLFTSAFESGYKDARYLVAASIDRYLSFTEGYQKYGTNRVVNQETGKEEWVPIDRKTPDSERAKYGVIPLVELLKRYPEQTLKKK
jgi:hypothetical protein